MAYAGCQHSRGEVMPLVNFNRVAHHLHAISDSVQAPYEGADDVGVRQEGRLGGARRAPPAPNSRPPNSACAPTG